MSLDPILQQLLNSVPLDVQTPVDWVALRAQSRSLVSFVTGPEGLPSVASIENIEVPGDAANVDIRVYRPVQPAQMTLIYIHGGGWTVGELDTVDHTVRKLCRDLPAIVVSCTYRLAPEHPFPAAYDDALTAVRWVLNNIDKLGGDPKSIVIAGDSAGGNLAAAVTIGLRNESASKDSSGPQLPAIKAQLLLYPATDLRASALATESCVEDRDPALRMVMMKEHLSAYLQGHSGDDWRASPQMAELDGLPPALVVVLDVDPLRDAGVSYANRLKAAGVRAELIAYPHLTHGFVHLSGIVPAALTCFDEVITRFRSFVQCDDASADAGATIKPLRSKNDE